MKLISGSLAENDEENVSVFTSHFKKVLNNHKPTEQIVIKDIHLREVMSDLDVPSSWTEFIYTIQELTNERPPDSMASPLMLSSLCQKRTCAIILTSSHSSGRTRSILRNETKAKSSQYLKSDICLIPING